MFEGVLCISCMSTDNLTDIFVPEQVLYETCCATLIEECFGIKISNTIDNVSICELCKTKLYDAASLKKQIVNTMAMLTSTQGTEKKKLKPKPNKSKKRKIIKNDVNLNCNECQKRFPSVATLSIHMNEHFPNFVCETCGKSFKSEVSLKRHGVIHVRGNLSCRICSKKFTNLNSLNGHRRFKHTEKPLYKCKKCDESFDTEKKRILHLEMTHKEVAKYKCESCNMCFKSSHDRSRHKQLKHNINNKCPKCDFKSTRCRLKLHLANIHNIGDKKHICLICDKRFSKRYTLLEHVRSHVNDRKYQCLFCDKTFVHKPTLKNHVLIHVKKGDFDGDPRILMAFDGQSMFDPSNMVDHDEIPEDEKECDIFEEEFLDFDEEYLDENLLL